MAVHPKTFLANKMTRRKVAETEERIVRIIDQLLEKEETQEKLGMTEKPWYRRIF